MSQDPNYFEQTRTDLQSIIPQPPGRVLEIGCAAGLLGKALKERGAELLAAVEISPVAAEQARQHFDEVICGDVELIELPFDPDSFDTIICGDVLEHLRDPWTATKRLAALLKPETGVLIASIPNIAHYSVWLKILSGMWEYEDAGILDRTHLRFFTRATAQEMITDAGLKIVEMIRRVYVTDVELGDRINHEFLKRDVLKMMDRFESGINAEVKKAISVEQYFAQQYIFIAKKPAAAEDEK